MQKVPDPNKLATQMAHGIWLANKLQFAFEIVASLIADRQIEKASEVMTATARLYEVCSDCKMPSQETPPQGAPACGSFQEAVDDAKGVLLGERTAKALVAAMEAIRQEFAIDGQSDKQSL